MSRPDTSIFQSVKPPAPYDPLAQAGKVLSLQQMIQQGRMNTQEMQLRDEQIQKQKQANEEEQKAAQIYRSTLDTLDPATKPEDRDRAIVDAFSRAGMQKRAQEYTQMQTATRKSLREADEAELKAAHQELDNKIQKADFYARNWTTLATNPDPRAYQFYLPKFIESGMLDGNDPTIPDPQTATAEQIKAFAQSHALGGMNTKDALAHIQLLAKDELEAKSKKADIAKSEAETQRVVVDTRKTEKELAEGLTADERDFSAAYKDYLAENKLSDNPPNKNKFRKAFREQSAKPGAATDFDKRLDLIRKDPMLYGKMFGRADRGEITPQDTLRVRQQVMDQVKDIPASKKEAFYEQERGAYKEQFKIDIGPYKAAPVAAVGGPPDNTPPKDVPKFAPGQEVYDKSGVKLLGYFDGYENGKVKIRAKK